MQKIKVIFVYILGGILLLGVVASAGLLSPLVPVGATMKSTEDIYQKLTLNTYTPAEHDISTTSSPFSSMHSLSDIWDAIPTIQADTLIASTTIMGIEGTYDISNLTPDKVLESATYGTSSVGTLVAAPDLVEFSTAEYPSITDWNTGVAFCDNLEEDGVTSSESPQNIWRLPTYIELVDASIVGEHPVSGFQSNYYWTSTIHPTNATFAYFVRPLVDGKMSFGGKTTPSYLVRCVR